MDYIQLIRITLTRIHFLNYGTGSCMPIYRITIHLCVRTPTLIAACQLASQYTVALKVSALMVDFSIWGSFTVMYGHLPWISFQVLSVHLLLNSELYLANLHTTDLHTTSAQILH